MIFFIYKKKVCKRDCFLEVQVVEYKIMNTPMNKKDRFIKEDEADKVDEAHLRSLVRCLMYIISTRSDILFLVSLLPRIMHCASELHLRQQRGL